MEPSPPDLRLIEPPSPEGLMPTALSWGVWCALGGAVLLLALLLFVVWRRTKRGKISTGVDLRAEAQKEALAALALCPIEDRTATATECSIILRRYLVKVTGDRALYETHEEWLARRDSIESLGDSLQKQVEALCSQLAQSKYAPADHGDEPVAMVEQTRQLIDAINPEGVA